MRLIGWSKDLPEYVAKAVQDGQLKVTLIKDFEYLTGSVKSPTGCIIEYQDESKGRPITAQRAKANKAGSAQNQ